MCEQKSLVRYKYNLIVQQVVPKWFTGFYEQIIVAGGCNKKNDD